MLQLWIWICSRKESSKHTNIDTCSWIFINRNNSCSPVAPLSAHNGACCDAIQFVVRSCILLFHFSLYKVVVLTLKWFCGGSRGNACVALWNCMKICNLENRQIQGSQNRTKSSVKLITVITNLIPVAPPKDNHMIFAQIYFTKTTKKLNEKLQHLLKLIFCVKVWKVSHHCAS